MSDYVVHRNGTPASVADLAPLAFSGYAHFTAMQVRNRRIRGLDLHLARLRNASAEMFDRALPDESVLDHLRAAVAGSPPDVSLTATVYSDEDLLIRTGPPATPPTGPLALTTFEYERILPEFKHVGEVAKQWLPRRAAALGFDDAAFVDRHGVITEALIWNLAFWDGTAVVWPDAPVLLGVTMEVLRRQLERLGVPQRTEKLTVADLSSLSGAVVMNSWSPGVPVTRIDDAELPAAPSFVETLHRAYEQEQAVTP